MVQEKLKILALSGNLKKNSSNLSILEAIASWYPEDLELTIHSGMHQLPHFNPDLDKEHLLQEKVDHFRRLIDAADGIIICTPEYAFSLPGSLKNAIEWTVSNTVFSHKPLAIVVAAASGEKALEQPDLIMTTIESKKYAKLLIKGIKGKIDGAGKIIHQDTIDKIKRVASCLVESINERKNVVANVK